MQYELKQEKNYRRKILVVDDELINRCLLGNIISEEFNVLYAENGEEADRRKRANAFPDHAGSSYAGKGRI